MADRNRFPDETWSEIASITAAAFGMDVARAARLAGNSTAKFIAAIPFLAGCREPERTALAHLATFIVASSEAGERIFDHKAKDDYDIFARLATISHFEGGDPAIINRGMKHLVAMMVEGYRKDLDSDKAKGFYNPLGAGAWKADEKLASSATTKASVPDAEMDALAASAVWWIKP